MTGAPGGASPKPESYLKTPFAEVQPRFSPDGRFVAYASDACGASEVYLQPFPNPEVGVDGITLSPILKSRSFEAEPVWLQSLGRQIHQFR